MSVCAEPPEIHIGMDVYYAPMSYLDDDTPTGFDVDLIREMTDHGKVEATIELDSWSRVLEGLSSGYYDAVSGILLTRERRKRYDFTIPYFTDRYAVFSHKNAGIRGEGDLSGKKPVILNQDAAIEAYLEPNGLTAELITTPTYRSAMLMIDRGEADYTIAPYSLGRRAVREYGLDNIRETGRSLFAAEYRFAVQKGRADLLFALNDAIEELHSSGAIREISSRWDFEDGFDGNRVPLASPWLIGILAAAAAVMTSMGATWVVLRQRARRSGTARSQVQLEAVLDALPWAVWWVGSQGRHENSRCRELLPDSFLRESAEGELSDLEIRRIDSESGAARYVRLHRVAVSDPGAAPGAADARLTVHCAEDYTERRSLGDTIRELSSHLAARESRLQELMITDELSGLYNRGYILSRIQQEILRNERAGSGFSVVCFDFPALAEIAADDERIARLHRQVGTALRHGLRQADVSGRTGHAEFMLILPAASSAEAELVADKIRRVLGEYSDSDGPLPVPFRCISLEFREGNLEGFLRQASKALREQPHA